MDSFLEVVNWDTFQHYKDRDPPWIKLYRGLLDDYAFQQLADNTRAHLLLIWLLASRSNGRVPNDLGWIASRIGAHDPIDLDALVAAGFVKIVRGKARQHDASNGLAPRKQLAPREEKRREEKRRRGPDLKKIPGELGKVIRRFERRGQRKH